MRLRVVHLNVHRFSSVGREGVATTSAVAAALEGLKPDVVTLNEVDVAHRKGCLEAVSDLVSLPYIEFFGHVRGSYGNAILSRYPLVRRTATKLDGGSEFQFPAGTKKFNGEIAKENETHRIVRGFLLADVVLPSFPSALGIGVTHLDHMDVAQRRKQLAHIVRELQTDEMSGNNILLMGDLNALTRADYSEEAWFKLEERARHRGWQLPQYGDLEILKEANFEDAYTILDYGQQGGRNSDRLSELTAPASNPMYRIDYAWLRHGSAGQAAPNTAIRLIDVKVRNDLVVSDHLPLVLDLDVESGLCDSDSETRSRL